jgi:hypothetical protein
MIKFLVGKKMDISKNLLWIFGLILILNLILSLGGCPFIGITGAISTGKGWHTDVVIHNGVIHTARYNFDDISVEYAYKSLTEDTWHVETVEKYSGDKRACVRDVQYDGLLKMVVDDKAVYIAYAGLLTNSIKLAKRLHSEGRWNIKEVTKENPKFKFSDMKIFNNTIYILKEKESGDSLYVVGEDIRNFPLRISGYITWKELIENGNKYSPYISHQAVIPGENYLYIGSITGSYIDGKYLWYTAEIRSVGLETGDFDLLFSYHFDIPFDFTDMPKFINSERGIDIIKFYGTYFHIITIRDIKNGLWIASKIPLPEIPKGSILFFEQAKYDKYLYFLFRRIDEVDRTSSGDIGKTKVGIAKLKDENLDIEWLEISGNVSHARFDISYPYIIISLLSVNEGTIRRKCREDGLPMAYKNYKGTHMIYIFDGKTWRKEVVK